MNRLAELRGKAGTSTLLGYDFNSSFQELAERGEVDCFVVSTEDGFSPLGSARRYFARDLGIAEGQIKDLADWSRFENRSVSLIVLPSQREQSRLRGMILAASESSHCYEQFAVPRHSKPYRDFYYNVAFESIAMAARTLNAKRVALSHLSCCGCFHEDIATCVAEALAHFCDEPGEPRLESFTFVGCCIEPGHLSGIRRLNTEGETTRHRAIALSTTTRSGFDIVSLDLRRPFTV